LDVSRGQFEIKVLANYSTTIFIVRPNLIKSARTTGYLVQKTNMFNYSLLDLVGSITIFFYTFYYINSEPCPFLPLPSNVDAAASIWASTFFFQVMASWYAEDLHQDQRKKNQASEKPPPPPPQKNTTTYNDKDASKDTMACCNLFSK
jgi:hypothetical protein